MSKTSVAFRQSLFSLVCLGLSGFAWSNPVAELAEAIEIARIAEARGNPLGYLVAAQVMPRVNVRGREGVKPAEARPEALRQEWLRRAKVLSGARSDLLALIASEEDLGFRGALEPVDAMPLELAAAGSQVLRFRFSGDADAAVALVPPDRAQSTEALDVDLFVLDDRGSPVCTIERRSFPKLCRWAPRRTGEFSVRVVNRGAGKTTVLMYVR